MNGSNCSIPAGARPPPARDDPASGTVRVWNVRSAAHEWPNFDNTFEFEGILVAYRFFMDFAP